MSASAIAARYTDHRQSRCARTELLLSLWLASLCLGCGAFETRHRTDEELIALFRKNRVEFERAVHEVEGHLRSPDTTIFCEPVKCELPVGVERIMISFGPSLGDAEGVGGARPRMVGFVVSVRGLLRPTSEKGIAYLQGDLVYPYDLVSDVDQYDIDSRGRVRKKVYRRIDSHWYVYFQPL